MYKRFFVAFLCAVALSSCNVMQKSAKKEISDGYYIKKIEGKKQKVYLNVANDSLQIYSTTLRNNKLEVDTLNPLELHIAEFRTKDDVDFFLTKSSIDVDFLTMPAKIRFTTRDVPLQLNNELNGSMFFGYRKDRFSVKNSSRQTNILERKTMHIAYSIGIFTGVGNTFMSPTTTDDRMDQEYDGLVWNKGVAANIGLNNFSVGIAVGFDNLLDKNHTIWIYENKPWIGLAIGLNLN